MDELGDGWMDTQEIQSLPQIESDIDGTLPISSLPPPAFSPCPD